MRKQKLQWLLLALALCTYCKFAVWNIWPTINNNDFKHLFFGMKALMDGSSPYPIQSLHHQAALQGFRNMSFNPYVYLPFTGQALAFMAPLQLPQAVAVWFILNHLFVIGSVSILSKMFSTRRPAAAALMFLSLAFSMPLYRTLTAGQLNLALLFLVCLAWDLAHANRSRWCGFVIAFAALFKLIPALYLLYFFLRRRWQVLIASLASGTVLILLSVIMAGPKIYLGFFPVLKQMGYGKSTWPEVFSFWNDPTNQSLNSFFSHILTINEHTTPWFPAGPAIANLATYLTTALLLACNGLVVFRRHAESTSSEFSTADEGTWCATLLLALLIPSLLWDHYLVMLLLPAAWMIKAAILLKRPTAAALVVLLYAVTCIPWQFDAPACTHGLGILGMSLKLWPTVGLFGLSLCFSRWLTENVSTVDS